MNNTARQLACQDRVQDAADSRLADIRAMLAPTVEDLTLVDDGTLDTVIRYMDEDFRFSQDEAAAYRDEKTGAFDLDSFWADCSGDFEERGREMFDEYGLAFDWVPGKDGKPGYFRYQISWGGPSEEIRFYVDPTFRLYKAEFWYMDWWDGACVDITARDEATSLWREFTLDGDGVDWLQEKIRKSEGD